MKTLNQVEALIWLVRHARSASLSISGRYYVMRMLHHIGGLHNQSKLVDLYYSLIPWERLKKDAL